MNRNLFKEKTARFLEVRDPSKAIGLWSHHSEFSTTLHPVTPTRETLGRFFNADLVRFETHEEALKMMAAKGWKKSSAKKLLEYAAQYHGERFDENGVGERKPAPLWFRAWRNFARWLTYAKTAKPYTDVRLSFGYAVTGSNCDASRHRTSRVIFLRKNGCYFVAVMMKEGWYGWDIIEKTAYQTDPYERLVLSSTQGMFWQTVDADIITELLQGKKLCLFQIEKDRLFEALTSNENSAEKMGKLSRTFEFYVQDPNGPQERFYMTWNVTFNANKSKYIACDRSIVRTIQVMRERKKEWIERQIKVDSSDQVESAARWVAENNGCIVLPPDHSDELRSAVMRALCYITFPDRKTDEPGGLLKGYQLPGRMVQNATNKVRYEGLTDIISRVAERSKKSTERKRSLVIDTLFSRAVRILSARNGFSEKEASRQIESIGGRALIETAAWRWGFMDGNALQLFSPSPQAGSLKLPDLSLALGFEHRLGLNGDKAVVGKLVQTAKIMSLEESLHSLRFCREARIPARRIFTPRIGTEKECVVYPAEKIRIIFDEGRYLFLAFPKFASYKYERDLLYEPGGNTVSVTAYRSISKDGGRSRHDISIETELLDYNKIIKLARDGRAYLYSLDVGEFRWLFDATFSKKNKSPCWFVTTIPHLQLPGAGKTSGGSNRKSGTNIETNVPANTDNVEMRIMFTANPSVIRDGRKYYGRSWKSYCDAYPADSGRQKILWPVNEDTVESLQDAARRVVDTDGVLITDIEHIAAAISAMSYVITQNSDPYAPGGVYRGYMLADRVFKATDGRVEWRETSGEPDKNAVNTEQRKKYDDRRKEKAGKPLVEIISQDVVNDAEREFSRLIEADVLSDKKTSKFFTLEKPIIIGEEFKDMVSREFRRVAYTGTMAWQRQLVRPAHEVALGIWLARLEPEPASAERRQTLPTAAVAALKKKQGRKPTPEQKGRLAQLDALMAEMLITQEEYDSKRLEILGS